ncbi:unnamed protein product (mitochondrion) [Plasmodiophora brassicae]|uniref:PI3K/PI4K catalytic domain-containing protein n=1 Tax=Plasmodiophora brassicae TaxID=37360 RepID=A0A0G4IZE1_PLABS|nr:hypothetical protein PBRA_001563 [Plasmodiophora brassicae]SPQ93991.1 unnamed protein product [Plasmodiophora brassicae]
MTTPVVELRARRLSNGREGLSGVYLANLKSTPESAPTEYIFKPASEEGVQQRTEIGQPSAVKHGIVVGDAVLKERAAYLVDHCRRAGVPRVYLVVGVMQVTNGSGQVRELGALSEYVRYDCTAEDCGSTVFDVEQVHSIGLLDCRIFNLDRHEGNLLVERRPPGASKLKVSLAPIDHGFSMPSWAQLSDAFFCWSSWRQARIPFSKDTRAYVAALDPIADVSTLVTLGIAPECVLTYVICSTFVQVAVADGDLTLADLAIWMQRNIAQQPGRPSALETLINRAFHLAPFSTAALKSWRTWTTGPLATFLSAFRLLALTAMRKRKASLLATSSCR